MTERMSKLISISGDPISNEGVICPESWTGLKLELFDLLSKKNGFYAFESSLLVRALEKEGVPRSLEKWNAQNLWKETYRIDLPNLYFFAEDIFGGQFALTESEVVSFDPETGGIEVIGSSLEEWSDALLSDYDYFTGWSLASEWQRMHGNIPPGYRLLPKRLFVLGGEFEVNNLTSVEEVKAMRSRGFFATELKDVPDGGQISFELVD